jgi:nucleoside 2-deoxyribosyltransferase
MTKTVAYLAGPMRGIKEFNFPAFHRVTKILRDAGYAVLSPAEVDEKQGYDWTGFTGHEDLAEYNFNIAYRLVEDIRLVQVSNVVICLEGWANSKGATAEVSYALAVGIPVYVFEEGQRWGGFVHELAPITKLFYVPVHDIAESIRWTDGEKL